jgi:TIGR03009 family protein
MRRRSGFLMIFVVTVAVLLACNGQTVAQGWPATQPPVVQPGGGQPAPPDQPVVPQYPAIERRGPVQGPPSPPTGNPAGLRPAGQPGAPPPSGPPVPFVLSPQEQAQLDRMLAAWEQHGKGVRTFECKLTRWEYNSVFLEPGKQPEAESGSLKFDAPDKGLFKIEGKQQVQWISDGMSIFEYKYAEKRIVEYKLPPELQGKAIMDGPLPFLFGSDAQRLKSRYFLRLVTPRDAQDEVWLEAWPRYQKDAAEFKRAELILKTKDMMPFALQLYATNGKDRTVYRFDDIVINNPLRRVQGNPYVPKFPTMFGNGWKLVVEEPPSVGQAARVPPGRR